MRHALWTIAISMVILVGASPTRAGHVGPGPVGGVDVKVTLDNNNIEGGDPTPSSDSKNLPAQESSIAISPVDPNIIAVAANDQHMVTAAVFWVGLYVSADGGTTWFNTFPPGFHTDTSPDGVASPLKGLTVASDPVVRFDAAGNLYLAALAGSNIFLDERGGIDSVVFLVKYHYTPGTPGGVSTPTAAANPPHFTYAFTTIVDRGSSQSFPPLFNLGKLDDKNWLAFDTHPSSAGFGNIYYTFTRVSGLAGAFLIAFSSSTDGGATFSEPVPISQKGQKGSVSTEGSNIAVAPDGTLYVLYRTFASQDDPVHRIEVVRSDDFGKHFGKPVTVATFIPMPAFAPGLAFRTPTLPWIAADDLNPNIVYVTYMALAGSPANADIFVARSTDRGVSWAAPVRVNDDSTSKHQFFPAIAVSHSALHVAWYDLRESLKPGDPAATNDVLNVFYASSNTGGVTYPAFSHNVRVTDVGFQPNCREFTSFTTAAFIGDYIELAARFDGARHIVHIAWADNRDIPSDKCLLTTIPPPFLDAFTGRFNQNIYADTLQVMP